MSVHISSGGEKQTTVFRSQISKADPVVENPTPGLMVVAVLRRTFADAVTFYFQAHGFHWNVKGSDFAQYHALFKEIYEDTYESIDPIAENILKMNGIAPFRLPELVALRSISDQLVRSMMPADMVVALYASNSQYLTTLNMAFEICVAANEQGIANFIAERIDVHQRFAWQLKASITV
jgi:starvation-inducible DNA-binding protein